MSVVVRAAGAEDIDGVVDLLFTQMSAKVSRERWRLLLDYPWRPPGADRGRVALDDGKVVGYLGTVHADRHIAGRVVRFTNICAWYLLRDYRGQGIGEALRDQAIADPRTTYTLVTATAATDRAFRQAGFQVLDDERVCFRRTGRTGQEVELLRDRTAIAPRLDPAERRIFDDHRGLAAEHILASVAGRDCYVALQVKKKGPDIAYHEIMHASDPGFLPSHAQALADALLGDGDAVLAIDRRFMPHASEGQPEPIPQPRLYRSPDVGPEGIDLLYNEIVLLDLKLP